MTCLTPIKPSIPAKAGIQSLSPRMTLWTPAFAGVIGTNGNVWLLVPPGWSNADMMER
ncbi:hypothetical protein [Litorimonas sp. WD9-15]|uniref:hypothetical protein n=1 Tax=Litorimonas sp. WD9-15 TaxID=3418716 RepID=UPI003D08CE47